MNNKFLLIGMSILFVVILCSCSVDVNNFFSDDESKLSDKTVFEIKENNDVKNNECDEKTDDTKEVSKNDDVKNNESSASSGSGESNINVDVVPVSSSNLSNTTCAWGFRRMKDEIQPEFSVSYTKPLDEYEGIYVGNKDSRVIYLTFD